MNRVALGTVCTLEYGKPLDKGFRKSGGAFFAYGANGPLSPASKYLVEGPCIIVGRKGSAGEITFAQENVWPLDVTYYVKHDPKVTDLRYLYFALKSLDIKQFVRGVKPGLNRNDVYGLSINLPSLEKQREIVEKLDTAFASIDLALDVLEQKIARLMNLEVQIIEKFLISDSERMEKLKLEELTTKIGSGATPRGGQASYKKEGVSLIRSMNVYDDGFRVEGLARIDDAQAKALDGVTVQERDVLLNITGASIARTCVVPSSSLPARVNQHVSIIRPIPERLSSEYLHYLLVSPIMKEQLLRTGAIGGSTRQALTKVDLENLEIYFPAKLKEQERIVKKLDAIRADTQCLVSNYQQLKGRHLELRFSLLFQSFQVNT